MASKAMSPATFASLLRGARIARGMTQERLAERSGLSIRAIAELEAGRRRRPRAATVALLAEALTIDEPTRAKWAASASPPDRHAPAHVPLAAGVARAFVRCLGRALTAEDRAAIVAIARAAGNDDDALAFAARAAQFHPLVAIRDAFERADLAPVANDVQLASLTTPHRTMLASLRDSDVQALAIVARFPESSLPLDLAAALDERSDAARARDFAALAERGAIDRDAYREERVVRIPALVRVALTRDDAFARHSLDERCAQVLVRICALVHRWWESGADRVARARFDAMRPALAALLARRDLAPDVLVAIARSTWPLFEARDELQAGWELCERAADVANGDDLAAVLRGAAELRVRAHHGDVALALATRALGVARDERLRAQVTGTLGTIAFYRGDMPEALRRWYDALDTYERLADRRRAGRVLSNIGALHNARGEYDLARIAYGRALRAATDVGDSASAALIENNVGFTYLAEDRRSEARPWFERARERARSIAFARIVAMASVGLAEACDDVAELGELVRAASDAVREIADDEGAAALAIVVARFSRDPATHARAVILAHELATRAIPPSERRRRWLEDETTRARSTTASAEYDRLSAQVRADVSAFGALDLVAMLADDLVRSRHRPAEGA